MKNVFRITMILTALVLLSGCRRPYPTPIIEEIKPNETAYLVPLEGKTSDQSKMISIDLLERQKVSLKRVVIPVVWFREGRLYADGKYIPTAKLVKIDRTPVTREWVSDSSRGTSGRDESITLESKDSIGFSVGVNITARVEENNTSKFLYYYSNQSLETIMDNNVRGFVQSFLASEFGKYDLDEGKKVKNEIFKNLEIAVKSKFENLGITIENIGMADGMNYTDEIIQKNINEKFIAENRRQIALQEQEEQKIRNATELSVQENKTKIAEEFKKAEEALTAKTRLEIELIKANAKLEAVKRWNGTVPANIVPENSEFLFPIENKKQD